MTYGVGRIAGITGHRILAARVATAIYFDNTTWGEKSEHNGQWRMLASSSLFEDQNLNSKKECTGYKE
eukprot:483568-Pelagomonas_calceolata.AAC.1